MTSKFTYFQSAFFTCNFPFQATSESTLRGRAHITQSRIGGEGVSPNDYIITYGGSSEMITVLHRGGPPNDYVIT